MRPPRRPPRRGLPARAAASAAAGLALAAAAAWRGGGGAGFAGPRGCRAGPRVAPAAEPAGARRAGRPRPLLAEPRARAAAGPSEGEVASCGRAPPGSRRALLGLAALALAAAAGRRPASAEADEVEIYFGHGNFNHLQHEFVLKEALDLGRREGDITAHTGYAGGTRVGDLDRVCYNAMYGSPDHVSGGHAQVVSMFLPEDRIADFTKLFLDDIPKQRVFEKGPQYRAVIGVRKGMKSKVFPLIQEAAAGRVTLVEGAGDEKDTFATDTVYVYDSRKFPWRPAETYNQFKDDPPEKFEFDYRELREVQLKGGMISSNGCP